LDAFPRLLRNRSRRFSSHRRLKGLGQAPEAAQAVLALVLVEQEAPGLVEQVLERAQVLEQPVQVPVLQEPVLQAPQRGGWVLRGLLLE